MKAAAASNRSSDSDSDGDGGSLVARAKSNETPGRRIQLLSAKAGY